MWLYQNSVFSLEETVETYIGFIYVITNRLNNKKYIGRKKFLNKKTSVKTISLKNGNKKKKKIINYIESDWKNYFGSSEELKQDVLRYGEENFRRDILYLCKTESSMTYIESKEIFIRECLEREDYYNKWVSCKIRKENIMGKVFT